MTELKTIKYRGGIAEFSIPSHWKEEYEPAGGAAFYEDSPDSGTLRLSVLGFQSTDTPAEQMAATVFREGQVTSTSSGLPLRRGEKSVEEHGEMLHIVTWEVAVPVPPKSLRLAIFSYTILDRQLQDPAFQTEIALLERSLRQASYSQAAGAAGNYESERKETEPVIREAHADDAAAMADCRNRDPQAEPADPRIGAYLRGEHNPQQALPPRTGFVAIDNDAVVAYIAGHLTTRHGCAGELQYLFVASSHRRRGIGTALTHHLASWFQSQNAKDVCIALAGDSPKEARPFFEALGATPLKNNWYHWKDVGALSR